MHQKIIFIIYRGTERSLNIADEMIIFDQVESDEILLKEGLCYNLCSHSKLKFFLSLVQNSFRVHACAIFKMFASACVRSKKFRLRDEIINSGSFFRGHCESREYRKKRRQIAVKFSPPTISST